MKQDDDWVRCNWTIHDIFLDFFSLPLEIGNEKFGKSVTTSLSKIGAGIIKRKHHHSIEPKTSTKSTLSSLAKPFEPASLILALPSPPTNIYPFHWSHLHLKLYLIYFHRYLLYYHVMFHLYHDKYIYLNHLFLHQ